MVKSVGRVARVPEALTRGPFTLAEAARHGLARWHLEGYAWRRVGPGTYLSERVDQTPLMRIEAQSALTAARGVLGTYRSLASWPRRSAVRPNRNHGAEPVRSLDALWDVSSPQRAGG